MLTQVTAGQLTDTRTGLDEDQDRTIGEARALVGDLSYGEVAMALCASDMPDTRSEPVPKEQVREWAAQGLVRLGLSQVRDREQQNRSIGEGYSYLDRRYGSTNPPAAKAMARALSQERRRLWGTHRRGDRAHGLAYGLVLGPKAPRRG